GSLVISAPAQNSVFEVSITGNSVAVHVAGNLILARDVSASLETRDKLIWTTYYFGFAMQSDGTANSMSANNAITTGYSGIGQGIQDYRPVHDIYGNTYQDSKGLVYFTADVPGWGYLVGGGVGNWSTVRIGVFSLDPRTFEINEVAIFFPDYVNNTRTLDNGPYNLNPPGGVNCRGGGSDATLAWDPVAAQFVFTCLNPYANSAWEMYTGTTTSNLLRGVNIAPCHVMALSTDHTNAASFNGTFWVDTGNQYNFIFTSSTGNPTQLWRGADLDHLSLADTNVPSAG